MESRWHDRFNPQRFLNRVDIERLLHRNEVFEGNSLALQTKPCVLCGHICGAGLVLNDRRVIRGNCFRRLSSIQYPERYVSAQREFLRAS